MGKHIRSFGVSVQLRGRGSGTIEPDTRQELQEPMFLEICSDQLETGRSASEMAQDLLRSVYEDHDTWCEKNGHAKPGPLEPQILASTGGAAPAPPQQPPQHQMPPQHPQQQQQQQQIPQQPQQFPPPQQQQYQQMQMQQPAPQQHY